MANLSNAYVNIIALKVGKEMLDYIKATCNAYYPIVNYDLDDEDCLTEGDLDLSEPSTGRWAYHCNLYNYFQAGNVVGWLGADSTFEYMIPERRQQCIEEAQRSYAAFLALMEAIQDTDGSVTITYTDIEPGCGWLAKGTATISLVDGVPTYTSEEESMDYSVKNYCELFNEDISTALYDLYGSEVGENYLTYTEDMKSQGFEPLDVDTWVGTLVYHEVAE